VSFLPRVLSDTNFFKKIPGVFTLHPTKSTKKDQQQKNQTKIIEFK
jgi:hypothetical protein